MGKGDRKSRRGKLWRGTHGKTRPKAKVTRAAGEASALAKKAPAKKARKKKA